MKTNRPKHNHYSSLKLFLFMTNRVTFLPQSFHDTTHVKSENSELAAKFLRMEESRHAGCPSEAPSLPLAAEHRQ
jgi:hypothetical protein